MFQKNNPENSGLEMVENNQKTSSKNFRKQFNDTMHEGGCESNCHFSTIECCHGNKGITAASLVMRLLSDV